jgi:hypothetical protein
VSESVRDRRRLPFFQIVKRDLEVLAATCEHTTVRLSSVRSVYFALLESANDNRADKASLTRSALGEWAGVSPRTVHDAVEVLIEARLLEVVRVPNEANVWNLLTPEEGGNHRQGGNDCLTGWQPLPPPMETTQEEEETPLPPKGGEEKADPVVVIFKHWQRVMISPKSRLDPKRARLIKHALAEATVEECLQAIDGCFTSDYHMARGDYFGCTRYNYLSLILRDREKIEEFAQRVLVDGHSSSAHRARIAEAKRNVLDAHSLRGSEHAKKRGEVAALWLAEHGYRVVPGPDGRPTFPQDGEVGDTR